MATSEAVEGILVWLEELRYPRLSTSRDSIAGLVRGEFGASLLWLSRHAVGRRDAAHIKRELHRLREEAPAKLSAPRREELGLSQWELSLKDAARLRNEESRTSYDLEQSLASLDAAAAKNTELLQDVLHLRLLLSTLKDLAVESSDQQGRINALFALLDHQIVDYELALGKSTASESVANVLRRLRDPTPVAQPEGAAASPAFLAELASLLAKTKVQLNDHVDRHTAIRPPPVDILEEKLSSLRSHVLQLAATKRSTLSKDLAPPGDERKDLLAQIAICRSRRRAIELESNRLPPNPPSFSPTSQQTVDRAIEILKLEQERVEDLLQLRADVQARLANLSSELDRTPIADSLSLLDAAEASAFTSIDETKASDLSAFDDSRARSQSKECQPTPNPQDDVLMQDARRALRSSHLLATLAPPPPPLSAVTIDETCDAIASTRFGLEALRPALEMELEKPLCSADLEEAVRQRQLLTSGSLLPGTRSADGKTLGEKWKRMERELGKERGGKAGR